mmetsp:Transcript_24939/g.59249  ORF Transcript_24939/g.59249 Transcript_24939/m.59249 type:complete len:276 (+) Transcript_24939:1214-2041(+)
MRADAADLLTFVDSRLEKLTSNDGGVACMSSVASSTGSIPDGETSNAEDSGLLCISSSSTNCFIARVSWFGGAVFGESFSSEMGFRSSIFASTSVPSLTASFTESNAAKSASIWKDVVLGASGVSGWTRTFSFCRGGSRVIFFLASGRGRRFGGASTPFAVFFEPSFLMLTLNFFFISASRRHSNIIILISSASRRHAQTRISVTRKPGDGPEAKIKTLFCMASSMSSSLRSASSPNGFTAIGEGGTTISAFIIIEAVQSVSKESEADESNTNAT